jgi:hypothetical protein
MMPEASILQHLEACGALVDVQLGGHLTLEPKEHIHAVSSQLFRGEHCFVLMGASHGSAISMARIAAIETIDLEVVKRQPKRISTDVDYMVSIRSVLGAYLQRPDLFSSKEYQPSYSIFILSSKSDKGIFAAEQYCPHSLLTIVAQ